jgi:diguanylate cyclase (GGDEF)-like protein
VESPVLMIAMLPLVTLPARFSTRGVIAGAVFTVVALAVAAVWADAGAVVADPPRIALTLAGLIGLVVFSDLLTRTEIRQRSAAVLDPLTGLLNRQSLEARFAEVAEQARLSGAPVSLLLLDIDNFKLINDEHGHAVGDAVLKDVAYTLRTRARKFELIYRLGGDELLVLLPGRMLDDAVALGERLRSDVESRLPAGLRITLSVGAGCAESGEVDFATLFDRADSALYEAKAGGRNQVVAAQAAVLVAA